MWTFGQCQHVLAFCVQVGWLANGQFENFLPPSYHPSCNCEFFSNSPSGLAFGHNHFLLNPVSGIIYSLALSSLPFIFLPIYSRLWLLHHYLGTVVQLSWIYTWWCSNGWESCATFVDLHLMVFKWMFKTSLNIDVKEILCELRELPTVKKERLPVICRCVVVKMLIACMLFTCVAVLII